jgi:hypothetical protein
VVPSGGHETENTSLVPPALFGSGAFVGVHVPAASTSITLLELELYGPAVTHEPTVLQEAEKRSRPGFAGAPAGSGATMELQLPPDRVSMKP